MGREGHDYASRLGSLLPARVRRSRDDTIWPALLDEIGVTQTALSARTITHNGGKAHKSSEIRACHRNSKRKRERGRMGSEGLSSATLFSPLGRVGSAAPTATVLPLVAVLILSFICPSANAWAEQPASTTAKEEGPPMIKLPLDVVEPPRNVPAAQWNSPYCGRWDDGCVECSRTAVGTAAQCHDKAGHYKSVCKQRAIICFKVIDEIGFRKICDQFSIDDLYVGKSGTIYSISRYFSSKSEYRNDKLIYKDSPLFNQDLLGEAEPEDLTASMGYVSDLKLRHYDIDGPITTAFGIDVTGIRCFRATDRN